MRKYEKEFLINLFQKWHDEWLEAVDSAKDEHSRVCYTNQASGIYEAIHYLKFKHDKKGK